MSDAMAKAKRSSRATVSGPSTPVPLGSVRIDDLSAKFSGTHELAAAMPFNATKAAEYDPKAATSFIKALAKHRHFERETDPPLV